MFNFMNVSKIKKIIRFVAVFIISLTFFISLFGFVYMESYNKSEIAKYNSEEMNWRDFCLSQNPPGGTVFYQKVFPFGFSMIAISGILVLVMSILALLKIKILYYDKYILFFFAFLVFLSYFILIGAWFGVEPQFYNCIGSLN